MRAAVAARRKWFQLLLISLYSWQVFWLLCGAWVSCRICWVQSCVSQYSLIHCRSSSFVCSISSTHFVSCTSRRDGGCCESWLVLCWLVQFCCAMITMTEMTDLFYTLTDNDIERPIMAASAILIRSIQSAANYLLRHAHLFTFLSAPIEGGQDLSEEKYAL